MIEKLKIQEPYHRNDALALALQNRNKINEIIDHLPQEKEDKIYSCACCFIAHGEGKMCPIHESSPDKEKIFITQKTDTSCSGKGYAIKTCCGNRVIKYSGTLTQEQLDTLLCENCHKPMPKQPTKEVSKHLHKDLMHPEKGIEEIIVESNTPLTIPTKEVPDMVAVFDRFTGIAFGRILAGERRKLIDQAIQEISALYRKEGGL